MGIILGFISMICFLLLLAKALTRKLHFERADRFFMKIHKTVSAVFLIACILHVIFVVPVWKTRSIFLLLTGCFSVIAVVLLITLCHTIKERSNKLRWHRIFSVAALIVMVCHIIAYYVDFANYQRIISEIHIQDIDVSEVEDGTYIGEYDAGYIYAKVEVVVRDGTIAELHILEHDNERGKAAEIIAERIVEEQTHDVDAVTGATNSSKVIKMAVQEALQDFLKHE